MEIKPKNVNDFIAELGIGVVCRELLSKLSNDIKVYYRLQNLLLLQFEEKK